MSEHREGLCELCGREYGVWSAPSLIWNDVMRDGYRANRDRLEFVCPTCFMREAEDVVEPHTIWDLLPRGLDHGDGDRP